MRSYAYKNDKIDPRLQSGTVCGFQSGTVFIFVSTSQSAILCPITVKHAIVCARLNVYISAHIFECVHVCVQCVRVLLTCSSRCGQRDLPVVWWPSVYLWGQASTDLQPYSLNTTNRKHLSYS